jgi:hypothetical protein
MEVWKCKYPSLIKLHILLSLQLLMTMGIFAQAITIKGQVAPIINKKNAYSCNCYVPGVRIYLNSYIGNEIKTQGIWIFLAEENAKYIITTSSYSNGEFLLEIPIHNLNDSLVFEHWAYKVKKISISELLSNKEVLIYLENEIILLPKLKIKSLRKDKLPRAMLLNPQYTELNEKEASSTRELPEFPGGTIAFNSFIFKRIKDEGIKIKKPLIVEFTISWKGRIEEVEVLGENCKETNNKIRHIFEQSPDWKPAAARGPRMDYRFALPIIFK